MVEVKGADGNGSAGQEARPPAIAAGSRRPGGFLLAAVAIAAVAAGIFVKVGPEPLAVAWSGLVRLALEGPTRREIRLAAPEAPVRARDHLSSMPQELRQALTQAELHDGETFRFRLKVVPDALCRAAAGAGLANPGWTAFAAGDFECASDLVTVPGSVPVAPPAEAALPDQPPVASTLYFVARGPAADRIATLRFKLNLDDPSVDEAGRAWLLYTLRLMSGPLAWSPPDTVIAAIREHRKLSLFDRGVAVEVHPEFEPVRRLNVVLLLERPASGLPAGRFVERPARTILPAADPALTGAAVPVTPLP